MRRVDFSNPQILTSSHPHIFTFPINIPKKVATKQQTTLDTIYNRLFMLCPCCKSPKVSLLNVEKVLNPPQKPTAQNSRIIGESTCRWSASPTTKPNTKQATIFTTNVPKGNGWVCQVLTHLASKKRVMLPRPPPRKTTNN
jgi:hypothetical protein